MITPRRFSLMNGNGEELDLLTYQLFLYEPEGLGFERDDEYRRVGNRWILVNTALSQKPVSGKLLFFSDDPYARYFEFIKFSQVAPLVLLYRPNPDRKDTYRRLVRVSKIEKSEVNKLGYLECPIDFTPLAPWYRPYKSTSTNTWWTDGPNSDSWHWVMSSNEDSIRWYKDPGYITVNSDSHMDSPCRLKMYGPLTNPKWKHWVGNTVATTGKVNCTVAAGQYLMVDNTEDPYKIVICDASDDSVISNQYQNSDFNTVRFITLQYGVNWVRFDMGSDITNNLTIEGMIYYESV